MVNRERLIRACCLLRDTMQQATPAQGLLHAYSAGIKGLFLFDVGPRLRFNPFSTSQARCQGVDSSCLAICCEAIFTKSQAQTPVEARHAYDMYVEAAFAARSRTLNQTRGILRHRQPRSRHLLPGLHGRGVPPDRNSSITAHLSYDRRAAYRTAAVFPFSASSYGNDHSCLCRRE